MSLADRIAGLSDMDAADLRTAWGKAYKTPAPRLSPDLLRRGIAYRWQEQAYGGLSPAVRRSLGSDKRPPPRLMPGTELVRSWNGRSIRVSVVEDGFRFEGAHYRSLSAIARAVTGTAWSGPRFFGLGHG